MMILVRDPRTLGWPLVGHIHSVLSILIVYVVFATILGPRWMRTQKPFNLRPVIMIHNFLMIALNAYFFVNFAKRTYFGGNYSWWCQGIDFRQDQQTMELISLCWWYFWVRVADFADTFFFCLRKKNSHITLLHVAHHCLVVFNGWFGLTYGADGQVMLCICLNSFIHILMYAYYFLSLFGPGVRRYLGWKRYLTMMQIFQFCAVFVHSTIPFYTECGYPRLHSCIIIAEATFFFVMFVQFYTSAYKTPHTQHQNGVAPHHDACANGFTKHHYNTRLRVKSKANGK